MKLMEVSIWRWKNHLQQTHEGFELATVALDEEASEWMKTQPVEKLVYFLRTEFIADDSDFDELSLPEVISGLLK